MAQFLKVPTRVHDAIMFLGKLAEKDGVLTIEQAATPPVSAGYLEQVALGLKDYGLIVGKRGPGGGYCLARPASEITIKDVIDAVEGPLALVPCLEVSKCPIDGACSSRRLWGNLQDAVDHVFARATIASLIE